MDEAHLFQFFQMMRKGGSGYAELFLDFAGDHAVGMRGKEEAENLEARLRARAEKRSAERVTRSGSGFLIFR